MLSLRGFFAVAVLIAAGSNSLAADDLNPLAPENADLVRVKYLGSPDLPDGVAFYMILLDVDSLLPEERDLAVALIEQEMRLAEVAANEFIDEMVVTFAKLRRDIDDASRALACNGNSPAVYGDAVYPILEAMDDTHEQMSEKHLRTALKSMSDENASRFRQWIDADKLRINHMKFNHKKAHERHGRSADALLAAICINPQ